MISFEFDNYGEPVAMIVKKQDDNNPVQAIINKNCKKNSVKPKKRYGK